MVKDCEWRVEAEKMSGKDHTPVQNLANKFSLFQRAVARIKSAEMRAMGQRAEQQIMGDRK